MQLMAEPLGPDLYRHLVDELYDVPPAQRYRARWVMNGEWHDEVRHMADAMGKPLWRPDLPCLLGLPVEVREDGGVPHLECDGKIAVFLS